MNIKLFFVLFSIILLTSTFSFFQPVDAKIPQNIPEWVKVKQKVRMIETENLIGFARSLYTTTDNPLNHQTAIGDPYDGVAKLSLPNSDGFTYLCSGSLLTSGLHILTAAHCVTDDQGNGTLVSGGSATFEGDSGTVAIPISTFEVHPEYDGDFIKGNDIAVLTLLNSAPSEISRYNHDVYGNVVDLTAEKVGYGISGFLNSGTDGTNYPSGIKRDGNNKYDSYGDLMYQALGLVEGSDFVSEAVYQYDSDDGTLQHDAFGFFFGINNFGVGINEVVSAPGDSGGPTLIDTNGDSIPDTVIGITSYGITLQYSNNQSSDCTKKFGNPILDSSCGEFGGDTSVFKYFPFIDGIVNSVSFPMIHMSDTTSSWGVNTYSSRQAHTEYVSPTSQLIGDPIDTITMKLRKVGSPTGIIQIGVFNDDLTVKKLFGTIDTATLYNYYAEFTVSLPPPELYTIQSGDRIGIKFTGGNVSNYVQVVIDNKAADPFDGTDSYYTYIPWLSFPTNDMYMKLVQTNSDSP